MERHINNLLAWIDYMIKTYDPCIGTIQIELTTQREIISQISYLVAKFENVDGYVCERLRGIKDMVFEEREPPQLFTPLPPLAPQYGFNTQYGFNNGWGSMPMVLPPVPPEKKIFINICGFCRLYEVLLYIKDERERNSGWLYIHPEIISIAKQKFLDGYYADAVESAYKYINSRIKKIYQELIPTDTHTDGTALMENVFSKEHPKIILDDTSTETGRNIQEGYGKIFVGAMRAIRNQTAHDNIDMPKEMAFRKLALASLLVARLEEAAINANEED